MEEAGVEVGSGGDRGEEGLCTDMKHLTTSSCCLIH